MKISVILPIYNVKKYLPHCLDSILSQSLKDIEIICINDGSSDDCYSILKKYKKIDNRIEILNQENNGTGIARNNGLKIAKGEFVSFLDPDDFYYDEKSLFNIYEKAKEFKVKICGGNFKIFYDTLETEDLENKNIIKEEKEYKDTTNFNFVKTTLARTADYKSASWFWRFIYERKFLLENNIFFPNYKRFQDVPFLAKALSLSDKIGFVKSDFYCYRINHKIMKYSKEKKFHVLLALNDCLQIYSKYKKWIQYSDILTIFVEMLDVFSNDFKNMANDNLELIIFANKIFNNLNFKKLDTSFFSFKKNIKNLKGVLSKSNYNKLLKLNADVYFQ